MKRGTKEFYEVQSSFERYIMSSAFPGYLPRDFSKDNSTPKVFYNNGHVNAAFILYMAGYSAAKCEYQSSAA